MAESLDGMAHWLGAPKAAVLHAVFARWEEIVGPSVAAHARPLSVRDGVLVIGADQPGWATQLRFLAPDMLARLASVAGQDSVQRVEIKVLPPVPR